MQTELLIQFNGVLMLLLFGVFLLRKRLSPLTVRMSCLPVNKVLLYIKYKCRCEIDYVGKTIQWLEVRIAQHVPGKVRRHEPITSGCSQTHESAIGKHQLNSVACRTNYSPGFFFLSYTGLGRDST